MVAGLPPDLVSALGLTDFGSPAGFLNGNLYAVFLPLLFTVLGTVQMNALTAGDEDAGNAACHALRSVGGLHRVKTASADDLDRMRRAFAPEYRQQREAQRRDPDTVARIEARATRPALEDRRGR
jgi:hypothetical protein